MEGIKGFDPDNYTVDDLISRLRCPLSRKIFSKPVVASDGKVYEEMELLNHIEDSNSLGLSDTYVHLVPLKSLISFLIEKYPDLKSEQFHMDKSEYRNKFAFNIPAIKNDIKARKFDCLLNFDKIYISKLGSDHYDIILKYAPANVLEHVLGHTPDINAPCWSNNWALMNHALRSYNASIITNILKYAPNIDVNTVCSGDDWSAAHQALYYVKNVNLDVIKLLMSKGMNLNCHNRNGDSPLYHGFEMQRYEVIEYILGTVSGIDGVGCERLISMIYSNGKLDEDQQEKLVSIILTKNTTL